MYGAMTPPNLAKVDRAPSAPFLTQVGYNSQECNMMIANAPVTHNLLMVASNVVVHCRSERGNKNHLYQFKLSRKHSQKFARGKLNGEN